MEKDPRTAALIGDNVRTVGLQGVRVLRMAVSRHLAEGPATAYDVVFLDPPYDLAAAALTAVLSGLCDARWLAPGAVVVAERGTRSGPLGWPPGIAGDRSRRYGEGTLWYGRAGS